MDGDIDRISDYLIRNRQRILNYFRLCYWVLGLFIPIAVVLSRLNEKLLLFLFSTGTIFAKTALISFILTLLPGLCERLGIKHKGIALLKIYRREIGILMYLAALVHVTLSKVIIIESLQDVLTPFPFEIMGSVSLLILFLLFITSNTISLVKLRLNWYRIQRLTYIGMFFIFLHVAFLSFSIWSILMGIIIILQVVSFIVVYRRTGSFNGGKPA